MDRDVHLVFTGRLDAESFAEFARHRAGRLALPVRLGPIDDGRAEISVSGAPDLVDAFEMACSLGPIDCVVLDAFRRPAA